MSRHLACRFPVTAAVVMVLCAAARAEPGLVGWWMLDDRSGTIAYDASGYHRSGTLHGGPEWVMGRIHGALRFDGFDDYVSLPIGPLIMTLENSTFAVWANFSQEGGAWQRLWDFGTSHTAGYMFLTPSVGAPGGVLRFGITGTSAGGEQSVSSANTLPTGWHHVTVTINADYDTILLWVDGQVVGWNTNADLTPRALGNTTRNWLGRSQWSADGYYNGLLDDLRIYSRVLSADEIRRIMLGSLASVPVPADEETAVPVDVVLSWTGGQSAVQHDVYFGANADDVGLASRSNPLGVLASWGQDANTYDPPGLLGVRQTYYWRVDEVDADGVTIHKGNVWSFSTYNFDPRYDAVYTTDEDFDLGTLVGVEHETSHDQLQLSLQHVTLPFIWVPNSNEGTVSKVDTRTGRELGRYRTGPAGRNGDPSRTTVDLHGNCWVGNRDTGTVVKIGLLENGQYLDRNFNGVIETSTDLNGDGQIAGDEILPWASDECVLYEVVAIPGSEGTYFPGQYQGAYATDHWNPGPRGIAIDSTNRLWAGCHDTKVYYYIDGETGQILYKIDLSSVDHTAYGAVVDENGILWSSGHERNHVLRLDPTDFSFATVNVGHFVYGLGIDGKGHLFVSGWEDRKLSCIDTRTGRLLWTKAGGYGSRGVACTEDGDVWVANSHTGSVSHYDNQGNVKQQINVGHTPTGVSVDSAGKVWVVCFDDGYLFRIDPDTGQVDLTKVIAGTQHYGYSDMTGIVSRTYTAHIGSWKVGHYAGAAPVPLGPISWTAYEPPGAFVDIFVRSSVDRGGWSAWEFICNGRAPRRTPPGCYHEIEAMFEGATGAISPVLYDLTVAPACFADGEDDVLR